MTTKYKTVITDINEDLIEKLTETEKNFYGTLPNQTKKDRYLNMSKEDRAAIRKLTLNEKKTQEEKDEEELMWKYASTLALHYSNTSFAIFKSGVMDWMANNAGKLFLGLAIASFFLGDYYFNTYARNRQIHVESFSGKPVYELMPAALTQINNNKQNINNSAGLMNIDQYRNYISQPNFQCGELKSITDSFYQPDGKPLCKKTKDGDIYVAGYVLNPTYPQPALNVIHEGKIYNFDMNNDAAFTTAQLSGFPSVSFRQVPYSFQKAFPDVVREATTNVVTKDAER
ncbi:hypothetical protein [Ralstonia mannitolilytica]|uniref:hypothetical protein n=1 Tax=Ralstonia mannitolilytica TaxID=105219 RepID=UPI001C986FD7|nr:hypothetical protein [Ralstonia mannitolilytica]MBY4717552.1 hypothetical protein [Ralstonia mannitolilytica]